MIRTNVYLDEKQLGALRPPYGEALTKRLAGEIKR